LRLYESRWNALLDEELPEEEALDRVSQELTGEEQSYINEFLSLLGSADVSCGKAMVLAANPTKPFPRHFPHQYPKQRIMIHKKFLTTIAVTLASAAAIVAAAPAIAAVPYTSSAPPAPTLEELRRMNSELILMETYTTSTGTTFVYGTGGFLSTLESDENLYVERFFLFNFYDRGVKTSSISSLTQIDCGRMLWKSLSRTIEVVGAPSTAPYGTPWRSFGASSVSARTCEAAAIERGGTWSFSAGQ